MLILKSTSMSKLTNIMIIFLNYPSLFITKQALKNDYNKLINIFINKIDKKIDINTLKIEINREIEYFVSMHKVEFTPDEINYFMFLIQFIAYIETLSNIHNKPAYEIDLFDLNIVNNSQNMETNMQNAQIYGNDLNRELERITLDVSILLKTIKGLRDKLILEESKSELLSEEKGTLEKKLAKEKRKTKKLTK